MIAYLYARKLTKAGFVLLLINFAASILWSFAYMIFTAYHSGNDIYIIVYIIMAFLISIVPVLNIIYFTKRRSLFTGNDELPDDMKRQAPIVRNKTSDAIQTTPPQKVETVQTEVIKHEKIKPTPWDLLAVKTTWAKIYTYALMPILIVITSIIFLINLMNSAFGSDSHWLLLISAGMLALVISVFVLFRKFKIAGYYLNILLLLCDCIAGAFCIQYNQSTLNKSFPFVASFIIFLIIWASPNIAYFHLRKDVFFNNKNEENDETSDKNDFKE